jgi:leucyl-tRNA synthetase
MSKSKKNVVDPNVLLEKYGADTTRLFCLFAAPPERDLEWSEQGVEGGYRFLNRLWRFYFRWIEVVGDTAAQTAFADFADPQTKELFQKIHETIQRVTRDIEDRFHFNTAISAVMELFNLMSSFDPAKADPEVSAVMRRAMEVVVLLLAPIVPHIAEALWQAMGHDASILLESWPHHDPAALKREEVLVVIQVNGKLRSKFQIRADADDAEMKETALADERIQRFISGKPIKKIIVVKKKLVNIVT